MDTKHTVASPDSRRIAGDNNRPSLLRLWSPPFHGKGLDTNLLGIRATKKVSISFFVLS